mgnify:CR=1 FL=1
MYFIAAVLLSRANSVKSEDVGEQREVLVGLHQSRSTISITRYFTEREKELKRYWWSEGANKWLPFKSKLCNFFYQFMQNTIFSYNPTCGPVLLTCLFSSTLSIGGVAISLTELENALPVIAEYARELN